MENRPSGWRDPQLQLALSILCVLASELLLKRGVVFLKTTGDGERKEFASGRRAGNLPDVEPSALKCAILLDYRISGSVLTPW